MSDPIAAAIAFWRAEHASFAHLLDLLERKLVAFHTGDEPDYDLMLDIVRYLRHFPDRYHHPREDAAFARMLERDPSLAPQINRLLHEHRAIATAGEELYRLLSASVEGALVSREKVESAAATYLVYFRHHIASEEINIMPRAMELLTDADWAEIAHAIPAGIDPLFGAEAESGYRALRRQIALEAG